MGSEWAETTLGELCASQGGSIQTGPFGSQLHASDYQDAGTPVVMPVNLVDGRVSEAGIARVGEAHVSRLTRHKLFPGDIVFSRRGDVTRFALITERESGWLCGTGCLKVSLGEQEVATAEFVAGVLSLPESKEWLVQHAVGATMPNLNTSILSALPVRLPDLATQRSATSLLTTLTSRMESLRQTNATLEAIAQALFKSWFVDFDPVRAKAEGREPGGMDAGIAALFPSALEDSELGPIPKGWVARALTEAMEINPHRVLKRGTAAPYLDMARIPTVGCVPTSPVRREFSSGSKFINGDTLLARITPCLENGKTAYVRCLENGQAGWGSTEFIVLRPNSPLPPFFAYLLARRIDFRAHAIQSMSGTSGRQRVDITRLKDFLVTVPDEAVANAFADIVGPIERRIFANAKYADCLAETRDSVLPRVISGRLRLSGTDKAMEKLLA